MKRFLAFTLSVLLLGNAHADTLNEVVTGLSTTIRDQMTINMWTNRCARAEALRLYANCYVNPEGVPLWRMTVVEREKWKPIAIQEKIRPQREYKSATDVAKEQGKRAAQEHKMNRQMCEFWRQQKESEKAASKVQEYCG
ncbi:hypothetical protein [Marinobacter sp. ANT_B65]|uniref:hypothetical protein n=1 Tax=Marinobacter sp. ANT_B65 TaxID=2039467 RepID=UPI000BBF3487|nr:hypothetical protein [Marinobacter sp. ANT_B65]PCM43768.1 hypothetical protein CPA50_15550 [Marinobacter sp. ANT_B65]